MESTVTMALVFLISSIFNLYLYILAMRFLLAYERVNYFNPVVQVIIRFTQPLIAPMRNILPNLAHIETATLILMVLLNFIKFFLLSFLLGTGINGIFFFLAFSATLKIILSTLFFGILLRVILSWIQPHSPLNGLLDKLTAPLMRPLKRMLPPIGGIDITPIPALILLQFLMMLLP